MKRLKHETVSIRTSTNIKQLLRIAAEREHRSIASMMEILILAYAQQHGLHDDTETKGAIVEKEGEDGAH